MESISADFSVPNGKGSRNAIDPISIRENRSGTERSSLYAVSQIFHRECSKAATAANLFFFVFYGTSSKERLEISRRAHRTRYYSSFYHPINDKSLSRLFTMSLEQLLFLVASSLHRSRYRVSSAMPRNIHRRQL